MDNKKVIESIENLRNLKLCTFNLSDETYNTAIEALEMQISKKPIENFYDERDGEDWRDEEINNEVEVDEDCSSYCEVIEMYQKKVDELMDTLTCKQEAIDELTRENLAYRNVMDRWID